MLFFLMYDGEMYEYILIQTHPVRMFYTYVDLVNIPVTPSALPSS